MTENGNREGQGPHHGTKIPDITQARDACAIGQQLRSLSATAPRI